jgi:hypothetical protein
MMNSEIAKDDSYLIEEGGPHIDHVELHVRHCNSPLDPFMFSERVDGSSQKGAYRLMLFGEHLRGSI